MFVTGGGSDELRPAPKPPAFALRSIDKLRRKLLRAPQLSEFLGPAMSADTFQEFVDVWLKLLPGGVPRETLITSLAPLASSALDEAGLVRMCWRFAGNVSALRARNPVAPWRTQHQDEWVPLDVIEVLPRRSPKGKAGADFTCRILAGSPAGLITTTFLTSEFCHWISPKMGFSRSNKDLPFHAAHQWTRLRFLGLLRTEKSLTEPRFSEVAIPASVRSYNHGIIKKRARKGFVCPKGYTHACHVCPVGYSECPLGTRPRTLTKQFCPSCDKVSYFDPSATGIDMCVSCYYKYRLRRQRHGHNT